MENTKEVKDESLTARGNEIDRINVIWNITNTAYKNAMDSAIDSFLTNKKINIIVVIIGIVLLGNSIASIWLSNICINTSSVGSNDSLNKGNVDTINQNGISGKNLEPDGSVERELAEIPEENGQELSNSCKTYLSNSNQTLTTSIFMGALGIVSFVTLFFFNTQERIHTALAKLSKSQLIYKDHTLQFESFKDFESIYYSFLSKGIKIIQIPNKENPRDPNVNDPPKKDPNVNDPSNGKNDFEISLENKKIDDKSQDSPHILDQNLLPDNNKSISDKDYLEIDMSILRDYHNILYGSTEKYVKLLDSYVEIKNTQSSAGSNDSLNKGNLDTINQNRISGKNLEPDGSLERELAELRDKTDSK